jgi:hypothetical protein
MFPVEVVRNMDKRAVAATHENLDLPQKHAAVARGSSSKWLMCAKREMV